MRILIICTGNTCRSPMAEGLLKSLLRQRFAEDDWQVVSAGIAATSGEPAAENAIKAMNDVGIDISSHQARLLNESMVSEADLILAMTERHRDAVLAMLPEAESKISVLSMPDPFGMALDVYRTCADELEKQLKELVDEIEKEERRKGRKKNNGEE